MQDKTVDLEFYKSGRAERVLERYDFSDDERKVVEAAVRSAQSSRPRLQIIEKADLILKTVAKTQKPKEIESSDEGLSKETEVTLNMMQFQGDKTEDETLSSSKIPFNIKVMVVVAGVILLITWIEPIYKKMHLFTYSEAVTHCKEMGKTLPKSAGDHKVLSNLKDIESAGYWGSSKKVIFPFQGEMPDDGQKHLVLCVDKLYR